MSHSVDPDETEPSHLDLHRLQMSLYYSVGMKGQNHKIMRDVKTKNNGKINPHFLSI